MTLSDSQREAIISRELPRKSLESILLRNFHAGTLATLVQARSAVISSSQILLRRCLTYRLDRRRFGPSIFRTESQHEPVNVRKASIEIVVRRLWLLKEPAKKQPKVEPLIASGLGTSVVFRPERLVLSRVGRRSRPENGAISVRCAVFPGTKSVSPKSEHAVTEAVQQIEGKWSYGITLACTVLVVLCNGGLRYRYLLGSQGLVDWFCYGLID